MKGPHMQRFLLIDDDVDFANFFCEVITLNGHKCEVVYQSEQILTMPLNLYDHIIVDLMMPEFDGLQVIHHIIKQDFSGQVSVISGHDQSVLASVKEFCQLNNLYLHAALTKPCDLVELEKIILAPQSQPSQTNFCMLNTYPSDLDKQLCKAIENNEIDVFFQPQFNLNTLQLIGFEALARWSVNGQYIPPDYFISVAEASGSITRLTRYIVSLSFKKFAKIRHFKPELTLAVNFSATALSQTDLPDFINTQANKFNIPTNQVTVEITETMLMEKNSETLSTLTRLRILGFKLSIDDFGTGYSSINMLKNGPFTELKIDRSFIEKISTDKQSLAIVKSIIDMAKELNLQIVAEGIENKKTLSMLLNINSMIGQGYYFSKPLSYNDITTNFLTKINIKKEQTYV
jgi:EAL domain-containing protein (putative c-di-GMP-specific phosphodiesterase class I)/ActR/RegA family two-component response regulator